MTGIPLVNSNSVDDINTSIIAIKKEMKSSGETEVNVNVNLPDTAIPVDEVTSGNMHSVTSNAVAGALTKRPDLKYIDIDTTSDSSGNVALGKQYSEIIPVTFVPNATTGGAIHWWQFAIYYNYVYLKYSAASTTVKGRLYYYDV